MKKELYGVYSSEGDMTFILEETFGENGELISTECKGFYYGEPTEADNQYFNGKLKATFPWND